MKTIKFAFRLVHIDNIPHILENGLVHKNSPKANKNYIQIGDTSVIETRNSKIIFENKPIGDFIPFYFGYRSPMLYVIQHGFNGVKQYDAEYLVYCVLRLSHVITNGLKCCFTDGHALDGCTTIYDGAYLNQVNKYVNYDDVYAIQWKDENDRDLKRRKEAELLLMDEVPSYLITGYVVYNENAKNKLLEWGVEDSKIIIRTNYYY